MTIDRHEQGRQPNPKATLERLLEGEPRGSMRFLAIGDHFASLRAACKINMISRGTSKFSGRPLPIDRQVELQKATASWALANETIRQRELGPDAATYMEARHGAIDEISTAYWETRHVPDPHTAGNFLKDESYYNVAEAVLTDLVAINVDRTATA